MLAQLLAHSVKYHRNVALGDREPLGYLADALAEPIAAYKNVPLPLGKPSEERVNLPQKLPPLRLALNVRVSRNDLGQLLERRGGLAASALFRKRLPITAYREIAGDLPQKSREVLRLMRRDQLPRLEERVVDAFLRVLVRMQDIQSDLHAIALVLYHSRRNRCLVPFCEKLYDLGIVKFFHIITTLFEKRLSPIYTHFFEIAYTFYVFFKKFEKTDGIFTKYRPFLHEITTRVKITRSCRSRRSLLF